MFKLACFALDKLNLGIVIIDKDFNIIIWNAWLERFTGQTRHEIQGKNLLDLYAQFNRKFYRDILQGALFAGQSRFLSGALHNIFIPPAEQICNNMRQNMVVEPLNDGDERYALIQISDMTCHYGRVNQLKNMIKEIGVEYEQVKASEMVSRHRALHDPLTGLPNRNLFKDRLDNVISLARRNGELLAVMFLDLDGFKEINDRYGHEAGDLLLQGVAERIKQFLRESDTLARLGGDEFILILPRINNEHDASIVADKINQAFAKPFTVQGFDVNLTISIGISIYPCDGIDARTLTRNADAAMYVAKNEGKNSFKFFSPAI